MCLYLRSLGSRHSYALLPLLIPYYPYIPYLPYPSLTYSLLLLLPAILPDMLCPPSLVLPPPSMCASVFELAARRPNTVTRVTWPPNLR
jgi:hypothetical protein